MLIFYSFQNNFETWLHLFNTKLSLYFFNTFFLMLGVGSFSLVIGISGGIDSSVSSTLSAMTGLKTIVLSMPIKQKSHQHDLSLKHQEWLVKKFKNVEAHTINLDELFSAFS